jgi:pimeloyl-ACP methyl ester carboxylesterase
MKQVTDSNNLHMDNFFIVNGLRLHYLEWGNPKQETVLLLHDFANCAATWIPIAGSLARHCHVLALDQRGHGDSQWADQDSYRISDLVSDVAGFLDALGIRETTLVGHSMGGAVAQYFTAEYPGRVDRLVIVDNGPGLGEAVLNRKRNRNIKVIKTFTSLNDVADYLAVLDPLAAKELLIREAEYLTKRNDSGEFTWKCHSMTSKNTSFSSDADLSERWEILGMINCPTLILRGAESGHLVREVAEEMVKTISNAELVEVEQAGHFVYRDNAEQFMELLLIFFGLGNKKAAQA